jgi:hypothetical protein
VAGRAAGAAFAIEYPLAGEDLLATTHGEIQHLRAALASLGGPG